jgi:hypothetical protein
MIINPNLLSWLPGPGGRARQPITLTASNGERWAFPRPHLVGFSWPDDNTLILRFSTHEATVSGPGLKEFFQNLYGGVESAISATDTRRVTVSKPKAHYE